MSTLRWCTCSSEQQEVRVFELLCPNHPTLTCPETFINCSIGLQSSYRPCMYAHVFMF
jgi:hypothetical protein